MKSQVLHTVWCHISCEAAGEFWHWSLSGVKGLTGKSRSNTLSDPNALSSGFILPWYILFIMFALSLCFPEKGYAWWRCSPSKILPFPWRRTKMSSVTSKFAWRVHQMCCHSRSQSSQTRPVCSSGSLSRTTCMIGSGEKLNSPTRSIRKCMVSVMSIEQGGERKVAGSSPLWKWKRKLGQQ